MSVMVETRCMMCGKKYQVDKEHPDFKKLEANPSVTFIMISVIIGFGMNRKKNKRTQTCGGE